MECTTQRVLVCFVAFLVLVLLAAVISYCWGCGPLLSKPAIFCGSAAAVLGGGVAAWRGGRRASVRRGGAKPPKVGGAKPPKVGGAPSDWEGVRNDCKALEDQHKVAVATDADNLKRAQDMELYSAKNRPSSLVTPQILLEAEQCINNMDQWDVVRSAVKVAASHKISKYLANYELLHEVDTKTTTASTNPYKATLLAAVLNNSIDPADIDKGVITLMKTEFTSIASTAATYKIAPATTVTMLSNAQTTVLTAWGIDLYTLEFNSPGKIPNLESLKNSPVVLAHNIAEILANSYSTKPIETEIIDMFNRFHTAGSTWAPIMAAIAQLTPQFFGSIGAIKSADRRRALVTKVVSITAKIVDEAVKALAGKKSPPLPDWANAIKTAITTETTAAQAQESAANTVVTDIETFKGALETLKAAGTGIYAELDTIVTISPDSAKAIFKMVADPNQKRALVDLQNTVKNELNDALTASTDITTLLTELTKNHTDETLTLNTNKATITYYENKLQLFAAEEQKIQTKISELAQKLVTTTTGSISDEVDDTALTTEALGMLNTYVTQINLELSKMASISLLPSSLKAATAPLSGDSIGSLAPGEFTALITAIEAYITLKVAPYADVPAEIADYKLQLPTLNIAATASQTKVDDITTALDIVKELAVYDFAILSELISGTRLDKLKLILLTAAPTMDPSIADKLITEIDSMALPKDAEKALNSVVAAASAAQVDANHSVVALSAVDTLEILTDANARNFMVSVNKEVGDLVATKGIEVFTYLIAENIGLFQDAISFSIVEAVSTALLSKVEYATLGGPVQVTTLNGMKSILGLEGGVVALKVLGVLKKYTGWNSSIAAVADASRVIIHELLSVPFASYGLMTIPAITLAIAKVSTKFASRGGPDLKLLSGAFNDSKDFLSKCQQDIDAHMQNTEISALIQEFQKTATDIQVKLDTTLQTWYGDKNIEPSFEELLAKRRMGKTGGFATWGRILLELSKATKAYSSSLKSTPANIYNSSTTPLSTDDQLDMWKEINNWSIMAMLLSMQQNQYLDTKASRKSSIKDVIAHLEKLLLPFFSSTGGSRVEFYTTLFDYTHPQEDIVSVYDGVEMKNPLGGPSIPMDVLNNFNFKFPDPLPPPLEALSYSFNIEEREPVQMPIAFCNVGYNKFLNEYDRFLENEIITNYLRATKPGEKRLYQLQACMRILLGNWVSKDLVWQNETKILQSLKAQYTPVVVSGLHEMIPRPEVNFGKHLDDLRSRNMRTFTAATFPSVISYPTFIAGLIGVAEKILNGNVIALIATHAGERDARDFYTNTLSLIAGCAENNNSVITDPKTITETEKRRKARCTILNTQIKSLLAISELASDSSLIEGRALLTGYLSAAAFSGLPSGTAVHTVPSGNAAAVLNSASSQSSKVLNKFDKFEKLLVETATALNVYYGVFTKNSTFTEVENIINEFTALETEYGQLRNLTSAIKSLKATESIKAATQAALAAFLSDDTFATELFNIAFIIEPLADLEKKLSSLDDAARRLLPADIQDALGVKVFAGETNPDHDLMIKRSGYPDEILRGAGKPCSDFYRAVYHRPSTDRGILTLYRDLRQRQRLEIKDTDPLADEVFNLAWEISDTCFRFAIGDPSLSPGDAVVKFTTAQGKFTAACNALWAEIGPDNSGKYGDLITAAEYAELQTQIAAATKALNDIPAFVVNNYTVPVNLFNNPQKLLSEAQKLINYETPPTAAFTVAHTASDIPEDTHSDYLVVAKSLKELQDMKFGKGGRQIFGLVVDAIKPGDDVTALYKAAAIEIGLHPPPEIKAASANRTKGARGWLFRIVRYTDSDVHHLEQITYINSSMYAVST